MPHCGSVTVTSVNAFSAASYSKEWSQATARLNCFWAAAVQVTGKLTCPSSSEKSCRCISCARTTETVMRAVRATKRDDLLILIVSNYCSRITVDIDFRKILRTQASE